MSDEFDKMVEYLYSQLPIYQRDGNKAINNKLNNTLFLCDYLNNPQKNFKSVHIAGTNGKGSSSNYLASICQKAGYKTGLYTSPHLKCFTERIRINGNNIEKKFVVDFVKKIQPLIHELNPSFFELTVAMCFDYFSANKVDIAIIEVGLGGRLDSTNVIFPEVALITNVSFDHQKWLGNSLLEIATEKAGIIKKNTPIVVSEKQQEIFSIFEDIADKNKSDLYFASDTYQTVFENDFTIIKNNQPLCKLSKTAGGGYQTKNINGVMKTVDLLNKLGFVISLENIIKGFEEVVNTSGLKGRWQQLYTNPQIFCDVAHNVSGIQEVLKLIDNYHFENLHIIIGLASDKDIETILSILPSKARYYFCRGKNPRMLDVQILSNKAKNYGLFGEKFSGVNICIEYVKKTAKPNDFVFIGGSNFLIGEIESL